MNSLPVAFREYREDIYDENGYLVERDVPHLVGEIDAREELGVFVGYVMMLSDERVAQPQYMELARELVTAGCLHELDKQRAKA